jgi:DNA-binding transcriptional regulator YiaG
MATGATVRALRLRLGLEVADFAFCLRVPVKSIKLWESKAGPLTLNPAVIARLSFFHSEI